MKEWVAAIIIIDNRQHETYCQSLIMVLIKNLFQIIGIMIVAPAYSSNINQASSILPLNEIANPAVIADVKIVAIVLMMVSILGLRK